MTLLLVAALIWFALHVGVAGSPARRTLVRAAGEGGFRAGFSVASVAALGFLIWAWSRAPLIPLWVAPSWLGWPLALVMFLAFLLFVGSMTTPNPTAVGGETRLGQEPRGWLRITRHPMLWSFALWSAAHVAGNGDAASCAFFGTFGLTALAGMPSIDAKLARRDPAGWAALSRRTSILPFGAILAGRNRLDPAEIGWLGPVVAILAWEIVFRFHPVLFGVSPFPPG